MDYFIYHFGISSFYELRRALNMVFEWLELHRNELMNNWEKARKHEELTRIEPLK